MIKVLRGNVPELFAIERIQKLIADLPSLARRGPEGLQDAWNQMPLHELRSELMVRFQSKCAYCESALKYAQADWDVEHFRPKSRALDLVGGVSVAHYWWLSLSWDNLLLVCKACNTLKGHRFPVGAGRAPEGTYDLRSLRAERPMLLDPCYDEPSEHLIFNEDGTVSGLTERGRVTIDIVGLNRTHLVEQRRQVAEQAKLVQAKGRDEDLHWMARPERPHSAVVRWMLRAGASSMVNAAQEASAHQEQAFHAAKTDGYAISDEAPESLSAYYAKTRYIERIEIENYRSIDTLNLDISFESALGAPWLMLLGENGTGKSTLLQALALVLLTEDDRRRLVESEGLDARSVLRYGQQAGFIRVYLTGDTVPLEVRFSANSPEFVANSESKVLSLAYGATRLTPRPGHPATGEGRFSKAENLFNPFVPLVDVSTWLSTLSRDADRAVFEGLERVLLLDGEEERIEIVPGSPPKAVIVDRNRAIPIDDLSDGYKSMLGLVADVMSVMLRRWGSLETAEGILLIDELGAHLHPQWKLRAVSLLRERLPRLQVFATTHDPLCLWGLRSGEIAVLQASGDDGDFHLLKSNLPDPSAMSVHELLVSELFGLRSTVAPATADRIQSYYRLLKKTDRTPAEDEELESLRSFLRSTSFLGDSPELVRRFQTIDEVLARQAERLSATPEHVSDRAGLMAQALWDELEVEA